MSKDFYAVLGASRNWTTQQIRERFLELARVKHPDRYQGDEKEQAERDFQEITEAFNLLSDPARRREIDFALTRHGKAEVDQVVRSAADVYLERGERALASDNLREAIENLRNATKEDSKLARAWHLLAEACAQVSRWQNQAPSAAARAAQLEPMNDAYLKLAGDLFAKSGDAERAKRYYTEALSWGGDKEVINKAIEELDKASRSGLFGRIGG